MKSAEELVVTAAAVAGAVVEHLLWRRFLRPHVRRLLGVP